MKMLSGNAIYVIMALENNLPYT